MASMAARCGRSVTQWTRSVPAVAAVPRRAPVRLVTASAEAPGDPVATTSADAASAVSLAEKVAEFQKLAKYNSAAVQTRTLIADTKMATLCTISNEPATRGFPFGAATACTTDEQGRLIISISSLSSHTRDLRADSRCSFQVQDASFEGMADARCCVTGRVSEISDAQEAALCREAYLGAHPDHFWVDFGDFAWFRLDEIVALRLIAGFGRIHSIEPQEYWDAQPDPVAKFAKPVCVHMNDDHSESTVAMVRHYAGIEVDKARMLTLDSLGVDVECTVASSPDTFKLKLPFEEPVMTRKAIKDQIVLMTRAAAKAT